MEITYQGKEISGTLDSEVWLFTQDFVNTWYVYYRVWTAGDIERCEEYPGSMSLFEVIDEVTKTFPSFNSEDMPIVCISPEQIEQFYPQVKENFPPDIVFFDASDWYWTDTCERAVQICYECAGGTPYAKPL